MDACPWSLSRGAVRRGARWSPQIVYSASGAFLEPALGLGLDPCASKEDFYYNYVRRTPPTMARPCSWPFGLQREEACGLTRVAGCCPSPCPKSPGEIPGNWAPLLFPQPRAV